MTEIRKLILSDWRYQAITLVLKKHDKLKDHCFSNQKTELRQSPHKILESAAGYSTGEKLLLKIALDIFDGSGNAKVKDLLEILDAQNFVNVLDGFNYLAQSKLISEERFKQFSQ